MVSAWTGTGAFANSKRGIFPWERQADGTLRGCRSCSSIAGPLPPPAHAPWAPTPWCLFCFPPFPDEKLTVTSLMARGGEDEENTRSKPEYGTEAENNVGTEGSVPSDDQDREGGGGHEPEQQQEEPPLLELKQQQEEPPLLELKQEQEEPPQATVEGPQPAEGPQTAEGPQPPERKRRRRTAFTQFQLQELENFFDESQYPDVVAR